MTQDHLEARAEGADPERIQAEPDDLEPLIFQRQWALDEEDPDYE